MYADEDAVKVFAKDKPLTKVLCMLCGLPFGTWESLADAIDLARNWRAPWPLSFIRFAITAPLFLEQPLRLYAIAARLGWDEEAKLASIISRSI